MHVSLVLIRNLIISVRALREHTCRWHHYLRRPSRSWEVPRETPNVPEDMETPNVSEESPRTTQMYSAVSVLLYLIYRVPACVCDEENNLRSI